MTRALIQKQQVMKLPLTYLLCLCLLANKSMAQISTMSVQKSTSINSKANVKKYDSLQNYLGRDAYRYIGQDFYLRSQTKSLRGYGYRDFYTSTDDDFYLDDRNIYKCCQSTNSKYEDLADKYFEVLDVIPHPKGDVEPLYESDYFIKLKEKTSGNTCYYKYDSRSIEDTFPFTVVGYFTKSKKQYIGTKYKTKGMNWVNRDAPMVDIVTGKTVSVSNGKVWKCVDVAIEDEYYELSIILESSLKERVAFPLARLKHNYFLTKF